MFTEAESLYQAQLSLLADVSGDNTEGIANGQIYYCLYYSHI